jgi:hypothetical protein
MQIPVDFMLNEASFNAVMRGEKAAAARRAAEVRKKLLKSEQTVENDASPVEAFLIGHWLNCRGQV